MMIILVINTFLPLSAIDIAGAPSVPPFFHTLSEKMRGVLDPDIMRDYMITPTLPELA